MILLLVATLATEIALTARTHWKLASHSMNDFLLRSVVDGRRHILLAALRYDQTKGDGIDTEGDDWAWSNHDLLSRWGEAGGEATDPADLGDDEDAAPATTYRNRDVKILAWCEDERSKLNLRGLLDKDDSPAFLHTRDTLIRLLDVYRDDWSEVDLSDSDAQEMVDDLVAWLREAEDSDENPLHDKGRGRLLSVDDLLRVPGGKWTVSILYDVRDPEQTERGEFSRTVGVVDEDAPTEEETDLEALAREEREWQRPNGVPGLARFLTVWNEPGAAPSSLRINLNTAPPVLVRALLEGGDEDLAATIVEHRRQGGTAATAEETSGGTGGAGGSGDSSAGGWFKSKGDLAKVEGVGDGFEKRFPRLAYFADFKSAVFSLRIVATTTNDTGAAGGGGEDEQVRDVESAFQYREVVQRTQQGFVSLFAERRQDPLLQATEE